MEARSYLFKVVHLVDKHVVVRPEEKEPLVRIVLNQLCDDDELTGARRLDNTCAIAVCEHIAQLVIGNLVVRVKLNLRFHVSCPFHSPVQRNSKSHSDKAHPYRCNAALPKPTSYRRGLSRTRTLTVRASSAHRDSVQNPLPAR